MMMKQKLFIPVILILFFTIVGTVAASAPTSNQTPTPEPTESAEPETESRAATESELQEAYTSWSLSKHAETYDEGLGANTNCARCKSPTNWDPHNTVVDAALDCYSCKRIPGEPRPELAGSETVSQTDWMNIGCSICHEPIGDSYDIKPSFWNQELQEYEPVEYVNELCAKCHEGLHGFEVIHEQEVSPAHQGWQCTKCHGPHGEPANCTDCHDPENSDGAAEHARHPTVNCTACHDAGKLAIYVDTNPASRYFDITIPYKFAHTITSWPSHNITRDVVCVRCHHPGGVEQGVIAQGVSCLACHSEGAVFFWCEQFPRDGDPNSSDAYYQSSSNASK